MIRRLRLRRGLTLMELVVAIVLMSVVILAIGNIDVFSHFHFIASRRRMDVQNGLSLALDHIHKYVARASGDQTNPALAALGDGFSVRVDLNQPVTPSDFSDDSIISYRVSTVNVTEQPLPHISRVVARTQLAATCAGPADCSHIAFTFTQRLMPGVSANAAISVGDPPLGLYYELQDNNSAVDVLLVGRWRNDDTDVPAGQDNPQVMMRSMVRAQGAPGR